MWVAAKELKFSYYSKEALLLAIYAYDDYLTESF